MSYLVGHDSLLVDVRSGSLLGTAGETGEIKAPFYPRPHNRPCNKHGVEQRKVSEEPPLALLLRCYCADVYDNPKISLTCASHNFTMTFLNNLLIL